MDSKASSPVVVTEVAYVVATEVAIEVASVVAVAASEVVSVKDSVVTEAALLPVVVADSEDNENVYEL
jgi:hypothetical protein